jgi:chitinase
MQPRKPSNAPESANRPSQANVSSDDYMPPEATEPDPVRAPSATSRRLMIGFLPGYSTDAKRGYQISDVPGDQLTYLVYCFAGFAQDDSTWKATTPEPKDETKNFPALQALKATYPNLRLMVSVGGATNSQEVGPGGGKVIAEIAASATARKAFVTSCLDTFIRRSPPLFDGIDLDWEFPGPQDTANFAALAREFRTQLNAEGRSAGTQYMLSASVGISPEKYGGTSLATTQHSFDWLNLMAYNLNTPKDNPAGLLTRFNAPLHASPAEPSPQRPNIDGAISAYLEAGVNPGKIVLGVHAYAHSYAGVDATNGGLYQPYTGLGPGTYSPGTLTYKDVFDNYLPLSGAPGWDDSTQSTSMYLASDSVWISPQMAEDVVAKAMYALQQGLGGLMLWELGADKTDENGLLGFIATALRDTTL